MFVECAPLCCSYTAKYLRHHLKSYTGSASGWSACVSMRGRQPLRPPRRCTRAKPPVHLYSTLSCFDIQLCMHRIAQELLFEVACTPGPPSAGTRARAMRQHYRTASAPLLHRHAPCKSWRVVLQTRRAKTSGVGSVCRH